MARFQGSGIGALSQFLTPTSWIVKEIGILMMRPNIPTQNKVKILGFSGRTLAAGMDPAEVGQWF